MKFQAGYRVSPEGRAAVTLHVETPGSSLMLALTTAEAIDLAQRLHETLNSIPRAERGEVTDG